MEDNIRQQIEAAKQAMEGEPSGSASISVVAPTTLTSQIKPPKAPTQHFRLFRTVLGMFNRLPGFYRLLVGLAVLLPSPVAAFGLMVMVLGYDSGLVFVAAWSLIYTGMLLYMWLIILPFTALTSAALLIINVRSKVAFFYLLIIALCLLMYAFPTRDEQKDINSRHTQSTPSQIFMRPFYHVFEVLPED